MSEKTITTECYEIGDACYNCIARTTGKCKYDNEKKCGIVTVEAD